MLSGDAPCIKNQRKITRNQRKIKKTRSQTLNSNLGGVLASPMISRRRQWHQRVQKSSTMPKSQTPSIAVTGDGRRAPCSLSDPSKRGLKPAMDHTHEGNQARTNIKASTRILKQSKRCGQGALKKIKCALILTPQR